MINKMNKRTVRNTFEEPYIHAGISREYNPKKLKQGFMPLASSELQSVKTPSQAQLRQMFYPDGEPRLYKSRGNPSKVIMNAQMRDYVTEQAIDDLDRVKAHREQKYINTTDKYDKLEAYAGDEKFDNEIKTINQTLSEIYGLSKQERDELKKLLLKDTVTSNLRGKSGLVIRKNKVKLPVMKDPNTGNVMTNKAVALRLAANPDEDLEEKKGRIIRSAKKDVEASNKAVIGNYMMKELKAIANSMNIKSDWFRKENKNKIAEYLAFQNIKLPSVSVYRGSKQENAIRNLGRLFEEEKEEEDEERST